MQLIKRKGSPYWYVRAHQGGRDIWLSTKETQKRKANGVAQKLLDAHLGRTSLEVAFENVMRGLNRLDAEERETKRIEFVRKLMQGSTSKLKVSDAFDAWLVSSRRRKGAKASTEAGYRSYWNRFTAWLKAQQEERSVTAEHLHEITEGMADEYAQDLRACGIGGSTYNKHISFLKGMFIVLSRKAGLDTNIWAAMAKEQGTHVGRRPLTRRELSRVMQRAPQDLHEMICVGLYTGLRLVDVVTLKWEDINLRNAECSIQPAKTSRKEKTVTIPLHPALLNMLTYIKKESRSDVYVFPDAVKAHDRDRSTISKRIQKLFEACGIETTIAPPPGRKRRITVVGFHSLRHSFVSMMAAKNIPESVLRDLVGHGSPAMTHLYAHADKAVKKRAIKSLPAGLTPRRR